MNILTRAFRSHFHIEGDHEKQARKRRMMEVVNVGVMSKHRAVLFEC